MIKKFKELGHSASLIQKLILISSISGINYLLYRFNEFSRYDEVWVVLLWFFIVIPMSIKLSYHLFPKKD